MADPKVFTGPEGYTFAMVGNVVRVAAPNGHPDDPESFLDVPLAELGAFLTRPETAAAFEAIAPAKPIDFSEGVFTMPYGASGARKSSPAISHTIGEHAPDPKCADCRDTGLSAQAGYMLPCHCPAGKARVRR